MRGDRAVGVPELALPGEYDVAVSGDPPLPVVVVATDAAAFDCDSLPNRGDRAIQAPAAVGLTACAILFRWLYSFIASWTLSSAGCFNDFFDINFECDLGFISVWRTEAARGVTNRCASTFIFVGVSGID